MVLSDVMLYDGVYEHVSRKESESDGVMVSVRR